MTPVPTKPVSLERITSLTGLSLTDLVQPDNRISEKAFVRIWTLLTTSFPDHAIALEIGKLAPVSFFGPLGGVARHAHDLRSVVMTFSRFAELLSTGFNVSLHELPHEAALVMHHRLDESEPSPAPEMAMAMTLRYWRETLSLRGTPLRVEFRHERCGPLEVYTEFFGCEVRFGQSRNAIVMPRAMLDEVPQQADRLRFASLTRYLESLVEVTDHDTGPAALKRVRESIAFNARRGEYGAAALAKRLGMSLRSVERKVGRHNTSVRYMLERVRETHARRLLEQPGPTVDEVASLLGYSAASAFRRAFKRWTGMTPGEFRRRMREAESTASMPAAV